ncbi:MAG TPA: tetratricopeptide repeat protein [Pyrinomonadaceae bacterium]|nr:tetratricopeptide repeat protein [Pyrinomonadaceae bacterium]
MYFPRRPSGSTLLKILFVGACLFGGAGTRFSARAVQETQAAAAGDSDELKRGIELYRRGEAKAALPVLRAVIKKRPAEARAWHFLGLALSRERDFKEAAEAFARAVKLEPNYAHAQAALAYTQLVLYKYDDAERAASRALALDTRNVEAHYVFGAVRLRKLGAAQALESAEAALKINPNFAPAWLLKAQALVGLNGEVYASAFNLLTNRRPKSEPSSPEDRARLARQLTEAAGALEQYIKLNRNPALASELREQLETLRAHAGGLVPGGGGEQHIYTAEDVTTKAVITTRPMPVFPRRTARGWRIGSVVLRLVLAADGQVRHIFIISGLPDGLTEDVIKAAREIKFTPATKDGRPVSQFITLEYAFNL